MKCVVCGSPLPFVARVHKDPFCSRSCLEKKDEKSVVRSVLGRKARYTAINPKLKNRLETNAYYASFRSVGIRVKKEKGKYVARCKCGTVLKSSSLLELEEEVLKHFSSSPCSPIALEVGEEHFDVGFEY